MKKLICAMLFAVMLFVGAMAITGCSVAREDVAALQEQGQRLRVELSGVQLKLDAAKQAQAVQPVPDPELDKFISTLELKLAAIDKALTHWDNAAEAMRTSGQIDWVEIVAGVAGLGGLFFGLKLRNNKNKYARLLGAVIDGVEKSSGAVDTKAAIRTRVTIAGEQDQLHKLLVAKGYSRGNAT